MNLHEPANDVITELDPDDAATVVALRELLAGVTLDRPVDEIIGRTAARSSRSRWMLLAAAAVACGVAGGVILTGTGGGPSNIALAEWTATPVPVTAGDRAAVEATCEQAVAASGREAAGSRLPDAPQFDGALIDQRGALAAVVRRDASIDLTCTVHRKQGRWELLAATIGAGSDPTQVAVTFVTNPDAVINIVHGAARGAAAVEVDIPDSPTANATVVDGQFLAWLPATFDWTEDPSAITIRFLDAAGAVMSTTHP